MKQVRREDGTWESGPAQPEQLPEYLRKLPSEAVTKDDGDPDKVHVDDAPHIVRNLVKEGIAKQSTPDTLEDQLESFWGPGVGERAPVTQWFVDIAKARVGVTLLHEAHKLLQSSQHGNVSLVSREIIGGRTPHYLMWHLVFNPHNVQEYTLCSGPDSMPNKLKHKKLRGIDCTIDPFSPPKSIVEELKAKGREYDPRKAFADAWAAATSPFAI